MKKLQSSHFDSCSVKGDKITIHKCVIDKAIKYIKNDPDPFGNSDTNNGMIRILEEMLDMIRISKNYEIKKKWTK